MTTSIDFHSNVRLEVSPNFLCAMSKVSLNSGVEVVEESVEVEERDVDVPCRSESSVVVEERDVEFADHDVDIRCPSIEFTDDGNFIENIGREILYVDDSIEVPTAMMDDVDEEEASEVREKIEEDFKDISNLIPQQKFSQEVRPSAPEISPMPLSTQIALPLRNVQPLCFVDVVLISKSLLKDPTSSSIVPRFDEVEEIGSACIMVEEMSDGNLLIALISRMTIDGEHFTQDVLTVVDKNLKLVHEKRIERSCGAGQLKVVPAALANFRN